MLTDCRLFDVIGVDKDDEEQFDDAEEHDDTDEGAPHTIFGAPVFDIMVADIVLADALLDATEHESSEGRLIEPIVWVYRLSMDKDCSAKVIWP